MSLTQNDQEAGLETSAKGSGSSGEWQVGVSTFLSDPVASREVFAPQQVAQLNSQEHLLPNVAIIGDERNTLLAALPSFEQNFGSSDTASPRTENLRPDIAEKLGSIFQDFRNGETSSLQDYMKALGDARRSDPDGADAKAYMDGLKRISDELKKVGINNSITLGELTIGLDDGREPKEFTINQDGETDLEDDELTNFQDRIYEHLNGSDQEPLSDEMNKKFQDLAKDINKGDFNSLQSVLKELETSSDPERIRSLEDMLTRLGDSYNSNPDTVPPTTGGQYVPNTNTLKLGYIDEAGNKQILEIGPKGTLPPLSNEKIEEFMKNMLDRINSQRVRT